MKGENEFAVIIDGLRNVGIKVGRCTLVHMASFKGKFFNNNINRNILWIQKMIQTIQKFIYRSLMT